MAVGVARGGGGHSTKSFATELIQDKPEAEDVQENNSQILLFSIISYKHGKKKQQPSCVIFMRLKEDKSNLSQGHVHQLPVSAQSGAVSALFPLK